MAEQYDVIVVGAGFGGPVAAKRCADSGLHTIMLERSRIPGEKVVSGLVIPIYGFLFGPEFIREGNPPLERPIRSVMNRFVKNGEIYDYDHSLRLPAPIAVGYSTYCKPFCTWLADRAVDSGVELRTATTVVDVIKENGSVRGVITDKGEELRSKIVIDAGGTQNNLSIKAGIRKKFVPEAIELYMIWDFEMAKEDVDRVFGNSMEFFHVMPEERIGAPLGYGSALYFFTYRNSIHPGMGQFLVTEGKIPNVAKLLREYFDNFTTKVRRWREDIAPKVTLRAVTWDVCPIYAGLIREMREMPYFGDGMLIIGDAAGFESAAFGDGVPSAWFSADIAAGVALEAIKAGDTSRSFLKRYEDRVKADPFIMHTITDTRRWDMREVLKSKSESELKRRIRDHWGIGAFKYKYLGGPCLKATGRSIKNDAGIVAEWLEMFRRYYRNWEEDRFDRLSTD
ncbi:MAG: NAD(P)/FAD-dependent oxidoreductase [Deltaproteobacteria bacterium]|nr:NAD(P)/FAD-dependent oxidoreductase [Deltaproteobacteria bacterium]